jgi:6-phospho-beta-glucosidase
LKAYRFSVSWPRVYPAGRREIDEGGLQFYDRLVDELLTHKIEPVLTLYHWDVPQALLEAYGAWESRVKLSKTLMSTVSRCTSASAIA